MEYNSLMYKVVCTSNKTKEFYLNNKLKCKHQYKTGKCITRTTSNSYTWRTLLNLDIKGHVLVDYYSSNLANNNTVIKAK